MGVDLDTTGARLFNIGLPGQQANQTDAFVDSFTNEATTGGIDSAGTIDFGVAVAKGTADDGITNFTATNGSQRIMGITTRLPLMAAVPGGEIGWKSKTKVGVMRFGDIFAVAAEDVREGDLVLALSTMYTAGSNGRSNLGGTKGGIANGTTRIAMTGHRWKTTTAQGQVGIIEVITREVAVLTS